MAGFSLAPAPGGNASALNVTAAGVIKASPGILCRVLIVAPGTAGNLVLNDTTTVGSASAANTILTVAFGNLAVGQVIYLNWPCLNGIVVSAVPTGSQISISYV